MVASELSEASASAAIQSAYVEIIYLSLQSSALKSVDRKRQAASNVLIKSIQEGLVQLMNAQYKRTLPSAPLLNKRAVLVESGMLRGGLPYEPLTDRFLRQGQISNLLKPNLCSWTRPDR